ncbi:hypothetical protein Tco_0165848, partial [Tanacetum coccineum]
IQRYPKHIEIPCWKRTRNISQQGHTLDEIRAIDHDAATEFVKRKKVTIVVGFEKTSLDIAREISAINGPEHPCMIVYRKDHWKLGNWFPWGIALVRIYQKSQERKSAQKPEAKPKKSQPSVKQSKESQTVVNYKRQNPKYST